MEKGDFEVIQREWAQASSPTISAWEPKVETDYQKLGKGTCRAEVRTQWDAVQPVLVTQKLSGEALGSSNSRTLRKGCEQPIASNSERAE